MMNRPFHALLRTLGLAALALLHVAAQAQAVDRIEPPFWWVGMKHRPLQLMVHGERIAELQPRVRAPGVKLLGSRSAGNPNYLFIDLEIAPSARPGTVTIEFLRGRVRVLSQAYELRARAPGSATRQGFGPADAIYLVVPDRFANGDTANDNIAGYDDPVDRANKGGRHGGDLKGIADHLDYIAGLGFTQLWPTPIIENRQPSYSYHGYSATDLYRVDPRLGTNDDYLRLVQQARQGARRSWTRRSPSAGHWWMADMPAPTG
jgi:hypothetical protein